MDITRIGYRDLLQADIIVTASSGTSSKVIRASTGGPVSHAFIYTGENTIVEAVTSGGVREINIKDAFDGAYLAIALRHMGLNQGQRQRVVDHVRKFKNLPYDKVGAAGAGVNSANGSTIAASGCMISLAACVGGTAAIANNAREKNADKAFFCSELVARAFQLSGAKLVYAKPSFTHPSMIRHSSVLRYVGHLIGT
jgi:uncharacterized protein YycO